MHSRLLAITMVLVSVSSLKAQAGPDSIHRRNDCRLAAQIIERGHPAPHEQWAYQVAPQCGAALGRAISQRFALMRTSTDTAGLRFLTAPAARLRDGEIFSVSLQIASDKGASAVARPFAFRNLIWLITHGADLSNFDPWGSSGLGCAGAVFDRPSYTGAPLPPDFKERVRVVAYDVLRDSTAPRPVRRAAMCAIAYGGWERRESW